MSRDEATKMAQSQELLKRPVLDPSTGQTLQNADSFALFPVQGRQDDFLMALRSGATVNVFQMNPEVAYNLGRDLLKLGTKLGWWSINFDESRLAQTNN